MINVVIKPDGRLLSVTLDHLLRELHHVHSSDTKLGEVHRKQIYHRTLTCSRLTRGPPRSPGLAPENLLLLKCCFDVLHTAKQNFWKLIFSFENVRKFLYPETQNGRLKDYFTRCFKIHSNGAVMLTFNNLYKGYNNSEPNNSEPTHVKQSTQRRVSFYMRPRLTSGTPEEAGGFQLQLPSFTMLPLKLCRYLSSFALTLFFVRLRGRWCCTSCCLSSKMNASCLQNADQFTNSNI